MWSIALNPNASSFTVVNDNRIIFNDMVLYVESNEGYLKPNWQCTTKGFVGTVPGKLSISLAYTFPTTALELQPHLTATTDNIAFKKLIIEANATPNDWGQIPGERLRFFREGWTMTTPAASHRYGEQDFKYNPDYIQFCHSAVQDYSDSSINDFAGEYLGIVNDRDTDESLLAGFVTSNRQVTRIAVTFNQQGLNRFRAIIDGDSIILPVAKPLPCERLRFAFGHDENKLLDDFAKRWGKLMKAKTSNHVPNGWCSWYFYFSKVTEKDIVENISFISENHQDFPLEYVQIDDGYQAALGDWLTTKPEFPQGVKFLAQTIAEHNLKPGIWLAPFLVEERSELYLQHPDWMVHDQDGNIPLIMNWRGCKACVLDGSNPNVQKYFVKLFKTLADFGFVYAKLDFLAHAISIPNARYYDASATRIQVLRQGLKAIRRGFGNDNFILGCTVQLGATVGIVDAERIGTDITPYWGREPDFQESPTVPHVCRNIINRRYQHQRLWLNDPDVHIARRDNNELNDQEIQLWTTALWLVGGLTLLSDNFKTLDEDRAKLSKLLLQQPDAFEDVKPLDRFERAYPAVWHAVCRKTGKKVVAFFNFTENSQTLQTTAQKLKLRSATFTDYWTGQKATMKDNCLVATVRPHACILFFQD